MTHKRIAKQNSINLSFCCCCFFRLSSSLSTFFSRKNSCCFSFRSSSRRVFSICICSFVSPSVMASCRSRSSRSLRSRSSSTSASCSTQVNNLNSIPSFVAAHRDEQRALFFLPCFFFCRSRIICSLSACHSSSSCSFLAAGCSVAAGIFRYFFALMIRPFITLENRKIGQSIGRCDRLIGENLHEKKQLKNLKFLPSLRIRSIQHDE